MHLNVHHNSFYHLIHQNSDHEWQQYFLLSSICVICVYVCILHVYACGGMCAMWHAHVGQRATFWSLSFPYTKQIQGLNSGPQVCVKCLYLLNHLTSLNPFVLISPDLRKIGL